MGRALSTAELLTPSPDRRRASDHLRLHATAAERVAVVDQRYTASRRALVQALLEAGRPLTITEILAETTGMPQSSAYRNLTVLCDAGVTRRLPTMDDLGRFELAEDLAGHHHHVLCAGCGTVVDFAASARLERALTEATRLVAEETGYEITGHRLDFDGKCPSCAVTP